MCSYKQRLQQIIDELLDEVLAYRKSPSHLKAMKAFPSIAVGKVHGYDASKVPTWEEALREYEEHGRVV